MELVSLCASNSWIILLFTALGVVFVFDPLGSPRPQAGSMEPLGVRHMESSEGTQFFSTARSLAVKVWESRLRLLCCCLPQDESHRAAFSSIAQLVSSFFSVSTILLLSVCFCLDVLPSHAHLATALLSPLQDTDLVPSDIAAGLALLHQEQDKMERSRDPEEVVLDHSPSSPIVSV